MRRPLVCALLGLTLLAGCSSAEDEPEAAPATTTASGGCPAGGDGPPEGADQEPTLDVDGDGRPDAAWIAAQPAPDGSLPFGVQTASGAAMSAGIPSSGPGARSVLVADVTGEGEFIALASDGGQVLLYSVADCAITPVTDDQGRPYAFDLGSTGTGTGVGCEDVDGDGTRDLVGLLLQPPPSADQESVVQQTVVELAGGVARTGATVPAPAGDEVRQELAQSVTCGDLDLDGDGVTSNS
jgi:hypothetical protein